MLVNLVSAKKLPKLVISSMCLSLVPAATLKTSDDLSVSARLEGLELGMKKVNEALGKLSAQQPAQCTGVQSTIPPAITVTPASVSAPGTAGDTIRPARQVLPPSAPPASVSSWASTVAAGVPTLPLVNGSGRQRIGSTGSQGQKRGREEDQQFQQVQNRQAARRQRKVAYGSSQVNIEDDGTAAPLEFYVGNTTPRATAEIIGSVLTNFAKGVEPTTSFKVLEVVQLATHLENPRTKSWKVLVPYKFKQLMEQDTMYPSGWVHRKFFGARKAKNNHSQQVRPKRKGLLCWSMKNQNPKEEVQVSMRDPLLESRPNPPKRHRQYERQVGH